MSGEGGGMSDGSAAGNQAAVNYANSVMGSSEQNQYGAINAAAGQKEAEAKAFDLNAQRVALDKINDAEKVQASQANNFADYQVNDTAYQNALTRPTDIGSSFGGMINRGFTEQQQAQMEQRAKEQLESRANQRSGWQTFGRGVENVLGTQGLITGGVSEAFQPTSEQELLSRIQMQAMEDNDNEVLSRYGLAPGTDNIAMRSSIEDNVDGNKNVGQYGVYGPGKIYRDSSGGEENNSPIAMLLKNSVQGLNPNQAAAPQQEYNPLWEALIPQLKVGGQTLADTLLKNTNFNMG